MMNAIRNSSRLGIMLVFILLIGASGCKSKKKAMEAAAAEKARMEQEAKLKQQQEDEQRRKDEEAKAKREADALAAMEAKASAAPKARLGQYFESIANSGNATSANSSINEALTLFASPETPVLIVISESGGQKDYDRPTTIRDYLNYLKDQKKNVNQISNLVFDASGKITEVELRKK